MLTGAFDSQIEVRRLLNRLQDAQLHLPHDYETALDRGALIHTLRSVGWTYKQVAEHMDLAVPDVRNALGDNGGGIVLVTPTETRVRKGKAPVALLAGTDDSDDAGESYDADEADEDDEDDSAGEASVAVGTNDWDHGDEEECEARAPLLVPNGDFPCSYPDYHKKPSTFKDTSSIIRHFGQRKSSLALPT